MKTNEISDVIMQWLNDAHSMELQLVPVLEDHAKDMKKHGLDSSRVSRHIDETRRHAEDIENCITRLGGKVSTMKGSVGKAMGKAQNVTMGMFSDELIKNALSDFAAENMEIASYTSLIAAAEDIGDEETANVCRGILRDEVDMANWIQAQIPQITTHTLQE